MNECNQSILDINTLRIICLCKIMDENHISGFSDALMNKEINEEKNIYNMITKNIDFSKASNIKVVKCFSIIFRINLFIDNYGFYIMFFMNILIFYALFYLHYPKLK